MCQHFAFWKCVNILQLSQCSIREMNLRSNSLQCKHFLGEKIKPRHGKKWFFYSDDVSVYRRQQLAWRIVVRWLLTNVWGKPLVSHTLTEKETGQHYSCLFVKTSADSCASHHWESKTERQWHSMSTNIFYSSARKAPWLTKILQCFANIMKALTTVYVSNLI